MATGGIQVAQGRGLHRFAVTLAGLVVLLIAAGDFRAETLELREAAL